MKLSLGMSKLKFSLSENHPNKMIIEGCITNIGQPSTAPPYGSDGKRIVFTKEAVQKNHKTFNLMPINCTFPEGWEWSPGTEVFTGHGSINIGVIEDTWEEGSDLMARIIVWKALFPDVSFMAINGQSALGFSIECFANESHSDDAADGFLYIDDFTGLGCAMLWKNTAAFQGTYIRELVASLQKTKENDRMGITKEELEVMFSNLLAQFEGKLTDVKNGVDTAVSEVKASVETMISEVKAEVDKTNTQVGELTATVAEGKTVVTASIDPVVIESEVEHKAPAPTVLSAGQTIIPNKDVTPSAGDFDAKLQEINASSMTPLEKCKAITKLRASTNK